MHGITMQFLPQEDSELTLYDLQPILLNSMKCKWMKKFYNLDCRNSSDLLQ